MSFQTKLLLVFAPLFIVFVVLLMVYTFQSEKRIIQQLESDIENIVHTVHYSTQKLTTKRGADSQALERFIEEMKKNKSVREVSVVNSTSNIVASSNPNKIGKTGTITGKEIVVKAQFGSEDSAGHHIKYDFVEIPIIRDNKVIGLLQTSIVVNDFTYMVRQLNFRTILITSVALVAMFFVTFFALYRLNKPLKKLSIAASKVASGDLSVQLKQQGSDEVAKLTDSFNAMTEKLAMQKQLEEKLRELDRRAILSEMASSLAHEIRNPLNLINLTADHLAHDYLPQEEQRKHAYTDLIAALKAEVQHLNKMVNEFLTIGRPSRLKKSEFFVKALFDELEMLVKQQLMAKQITLMVVDILQKKVHADIEQMRLVFLNILLNAIEALAVGGVIEVKIQAASNDKMQIVIRDNGSGIGPEYLEQIFEPYFSKRPGGTGLGLALARRIIEEHGGTIVATNADHGGAQFEIVLPMEMKFEKANI